jgi:hypothetical protein
MAHVAEYPEPHAVRDPMIDNPVSSIRSMRYSTTVALVLLPTVVAETLQFLLTSGGDGMDGMCKHLCPDFTRVEACLIPTHRHAQGSDYAW